MKLKKNKADILLEGVSLVLLIGVTLYLILNWSSIPEKIPMHFNAAGVIDRWGSKGELIIVPGMAWFLYLMITGFQQIPMIWNTGVKVTEDNKERVYRNLNYMIGTTKLIMIITFAILSVYPLLGVNLPWWWTFLELGLVFGNLTFWLIKLYREQ